MKIDVIGAPISEEEQKYYWEYFAEKAEMEGRELERLVLTVDEKDPEFICAEWYLKPIYFSRLRRITGYLVGDLSRWNDAKYAEQKDRVKHG